jgi:shikimate dehydrogenase
MSEIGIRIGGSTRLFAIIGDPIAQVRSPKDFTQRFAAEGMDAVFVPAHIPAAKFDEVMPALLGLANLDGLVITVPFKARMAPFATRLGGAAKVIGAVNAMRREADGTWSGDMFDGAGFVRAARQHGHRLEGRRVLMFGAGGAGSGIACALAEAGVAAIDIADPIAERAPALFARLAPAFPQCRFGAASAQRTGYDMIVNASTVGMRPGDGLPGDIGPLSSNVLVGEVVNADTPTPLEQEAIRHGCGRVRGLEMHGAQMDTLMGYLTGKL